MTNRNEGAAGAPWQSKAKLTKALRENDWSNRRTAAALDCGETTIRKWRDEHGIDGPKRRGTAEPRPETKAEKPGFDVDGDSARIVSEAGVELGDVDTLIRDRGLNPADWDVERVKVNEWEAYAGRNEPFGEPETVTLRQLTVHLKRKKTWDFLRAAATPIDRSFTKQQQATAGARLEWVGGDQQASYHDPKLHAAVCRFLADVKPDGLNLTGDTVDFPTISRHADRPHWNATPQECIDAAVQLLYDYRCAAPEATARKLRGNHDWRIESEMLTRAERLFGLRPGHLDGDAECVPLYSIRRLLRLDELGIELHGREGDKWEIAEIKLTDDLVVCHRPPSKQKMTRLGRDVIAGDSHRQAIEHVTTYERGAPVVRTLMQVGLLAQANGLGYTADPDWQQGFGTVTLWPDGRRAFELARWDGHALTWRGETWR